LAPGLQSLNLNKPMGFEMTYYTKPSTTFTEDVKARLGEIEISKAALRKIAIGSALSCAALMAVMAFAPKKSDQGTVQNHAEYSVKSQTTAKVPGQTLNAEEDVAPKADTTARAIPGEKLYRKVDNAVRDVQIDAMVKSKPLSRAIQSNDNPVKAFFIKLTRLITLPGLFLGLAFIFSLGFLGFIRPDGEDLGNY
jgi:hypothetical protein